MKGKERNPKDLWKRNHPAVLGTITGLRDRKQLEDFKAMQQANRLYRGEK